MSPSFQQMFSSSNTGCRCVILRCTLRHDGEGVRTSSNIRRKSSLCLDVIGQPFSCSRGLCRGRRIPIPVGPLNRGAGQQRTRYQRHGFDQNQQKKRNWKIVSLRGVRRRGGSLLIESRGRTVRITNDGEGELVMAERWLSRRI